MQLVISAATAHLAQVLGDALAGEHHVRLTAQQPVATSHEFVLSALGPDYGTNLLVRGMDAIVHVCEPAPGAADTAQIDYATRCTYNLLVAAAAERVPRIVLFSSLDLMGAYDEANPGINFIVTERWRPLPDHRPAHLVKHLAEVVCREFAREHKLQVVVLRLGHVVRADAVADQPADPMWVDERDVVQAVRQALTAELGPWTVCHIQGDWPGARFPVAQARRILGYDPIYQFAGAGGG